MAYDSQLVYYSTTQLLALSTKHLMTSKRRYSQRTRGNAPRKGRQGRAKALFEGPRIDPQLKKTFSKIGIPEASPFIPDPFQIEALDKIKKNDVLVSAPTGSGKTWIASQAISDYLSRGLRTWYASPLKALSNSIYQEFRNEFGSSICGILTGDRKENPDAPIIVGTTEILRNQLYDAMHEGTSINADLVVLDEAHYLSDPDRGVVWEEVLIYLSSRVRLLLLSATISNAEEILSWLEKIRDRSGRVVRSDERPVSLEMLFIFPDGLLSLLAGRKALVPKVKKFVASHKGRSRQRRGVGKLNFDGIIKCLREFDLLPAIFFLKSRKDCDRALQSLTLSKQPFDTRNRLKREVRSFLSKYPHLENHKQIRSLIDSRVGAHHAGQLPYWKVLVEQMMNKGYLDAIFSTSTVAAGVNFPARTVALVQSDKYDGREFTDLTATDLHQMTGRAGRRGKDNIGFALVIPGLHQDPQLIYELRDSKPEPLMSQININFSMTLNLLLSHTPNEVRALLERSFASYQEKRHGSVLEKKWQAMAEILRDEIPQGMCDISDPYEILENVQKRAELLKEAKQLSKGIRKEKRLSTFKEYLKPGRLFLHKNRGVYITFHTYEENGRFISAAYDIRKKIRSRRRKGFKPKKVDFDQIRALYDYRLRLPEDYSIDRLQILFDSIDLESLEILHMEPSVNGPNSEEQRHIKDRLKLLPCDECEHLKDCHTLRNRELKRILKSFRSLAFDMEGLGGGLWVSFKRHLRFLKDHGFIGADDQLTRDGVWASKLRLDHPLLIAEAIRKGGFQETLPELLAAGIAPFVWDRSQDMEFKIQGPINLKECESVFYRILEKIADIRSWKTKRGFENPNIMFWPAAALFMWAKGVPWEKLLFFIPIDEGDMASLIMRTADHLRQVTNLKETHPELADSAKTAIEQIMREPVFIE